MFVALVLCLTPPAAPTGAALARLPVLAVSAGSVYQVGALLRPDPLDPPYEDVVRPLALSGALGGHRVAGGRHRGRSASACASWDLSCDWSWPGVAQRETRGGQLLWLVAGTLALVAVRRRLVRGLLRGAGRDRRGANESASSSASRSGSAAGSVLRYRATRRASRRRPGRLRRGPQPSRSVALLVVLAMVARDDLPRQRTAADRARHTRGRRGRALGLPLGPPDCRRTGEPEPARRGGDRSARLGRGSLTWMSLLHAALARPHRTDALSGRGRHLEHDGRELGTPAASSVDVHRRCRGHRQAGVRPARSTRDRGGGRRGSRGPRSTTSRCGRSWLARSSWSAGREPGWPRRTWTSAAAWSAISTTVRNSGCWPSRCSCRQPA